jgi:hypothetical protein
VMVVLPASGCEMIANVRRRAISASLFDMTGAFTDAPPMRQRSRRAIART